MQPNAVNGAVTVKLGGENIREATLELVVWLGVALQQLKNKAWGRGGRAGDAILYLQTSFILPLSFLGSVEGRGLKMLQERGGIQPSFRVQVGFAAN